MTANINQELSQIEQQYRAFDRSDQLALQRRIKEISRDYEVRP